MQQDENAPALIITRVTMPPMVAKPRDPCAGIRRERDLWRLVFTLVAVAFVLGLAVWSGLEAASRQ